MLKQSAFIVVGVKHSEQSAQGVAVERENDS